MLDPFGITYESTIINSYSIIACLIFMIILHIWIIFLKYLFAMCKDCKRSFIKCISKVVLKLFNFMTLDYYIRNFLEISQFLLLSSINEIYDFNVLGTVRIISLTYAILLIVLFIFILLMVNYLIFTNYELDENQHKMFEEFFCWLQNNRKPRFYITMLLLRRCSFVTLLITLSQFPSRHIIGVFIFIQFLYGAFIILTRPYKETKWNFIEIINEVYFLLFLIAFIVFNTESEWSIYKTDIFIWTYLSNSIIVFIIVIGKNISNHLIVGLIKALFVWIKSKWQQNSVRIRVIKNIEYSRKLKQSWTFTSFYCKFLL